jgi:PAS domain-containing protein
MGRSFEMTDRFSPLRKKESSELGNSAKMLKENEQRWITTLSSISDAVMATDLFGKITFMNMMAEKLTGWTLNEATQIPVDKIFNIIKGSSREKVETPVSCVLKDGRCWFGKQHNFTQVLAFQKMQRLSCLHPCLLLNQKVRALA